MHYHSRSKLIACGVPFLTKFLKRKPTKPKTKITYKKHLVDISSRNYVDVYSYTVARMSVGDCMRTRRCQ